jgi:hypothetical protein
MHFKTCRKGGPNARIILGRLRADHGLTGSLFRQTEVFEVTSGLPIIRELASGISERGRGSRYPW